MYRFRIPIALLLILALPLQGFGRVSCCQRGGLNCCSQAHGAAQNRKTCCQEGRKQTSRHCSNCLAAEKERDETEPVSFGAAGGCRCQIKSAPCEQPLKPLSWRTTISAVRAECTFAFVSARLPALTLSYQWKGDEKLPLRVHAMNSVWLI